MALPYNDKIIGDLGHTEDHNSIINEINFVKENYLSASGGTLNDFLRKDSASAIYATRNSPTFTGTPAAPTAASATNNTQIATTAFVRSEVSALVDSAPSTLDTLNELAAALGDDPNFATTITQSLSNKLDLGVASATYLTVANATETYFLKSASGGLLTESEATGLYLPISASSSLSPIGYLTASAAANIYAPLNSPALAGTPTAPTASAGNNTNQIATTEFVSFAVLSAQSGSVDLSSYLTTSAASAIYLPISSSSNYLFASTASTIYATKISPIFTGIPTAPTASANNSSNQIATTSFVAQAVLEVQTGSAVDLSEYLRADTASATYLRRDTASAVYLPISASSNYLFAGTASATYLRQDTASALYSTKTINIKTASVDYTAVANDSGNLIKLDSLSSIKFIIPDNFSVPFPVGTKIDILQTNTGTVTASFVAGVTLNSNSGNNLSGQWAAASLVKLDTDSWVIIGSIE